MEEEEEGAAAIMAGLSRTLGIFGGFVAVVGAALYPIYFRPLLLPDEYSECRGAAGSRGAPGSRVPRGRSALPHGAPAVCPPPGTPLPAAGGAPEGVLGRMTKNRAANLLIFSEGL